MCTTIAPLHRIVKGQAKRFLSECTTVALETRSVAGSMAYCLNSIKADRDSINDSACCSFRTISRNMGWTFGSSVSTEKQILTWDLLPPTNGKFFILCIVTGSMG